MKIGHFSDLHFAAEHLEEVDRCMTAAVAAAIDEAIDVAVISGDATDHRIDLHSPAAQALAWHIHTLSNHCPVLMLQGTFSHEPQGTLEIFRHIGGKYPVFVAQDIQQVALLENRTWLSSLECGEHGGWLFRERGSWLFSSVPQKALALFSCLPTINKAHIVASLDKEDDVTTGDVVLQLLQGFAPVNEAARKIDIPTVFVSHGTVHGCVTEHGVPMLGFDHEFTSGALFATKASAILLGHIHKNQSWLNTLPGYGNQVVAYAGSIGRLHYGEEGEKGWLFWDVEAGNAACMLMPTPSRKLVHLDFPGLPDMAVIQSTLAEVPDAFVRVRYQVDEEHRHAVNREGIVQLLDKAGAAQVKVEGRVAPVTRVRAEGISRTHTPDEKLSQWAAVTDVAVAPLIGRLHLLAQKTPEEISQDIIAGKRATAMVEKPAPDSASLSARPSSEPPESVEPQAPTVIAESAPPTAETPATPTHINGPSLDMPDLESLF